MKDPISTYDKMMKMRIEQDRAIENYHWNKLINSLNTKRIKKTKTSKFSRVKSKGQLVELEYKDLLSPSGRSLQKNEKQKTKN